MCTLLDAFEKEGLEKGMKKGMAQGMLQGREEGIKDGRYSLAEDFAKRNSMNIETSMTQLGFSDEEKAGYNAWKAKKNQEDKKTA